MPTYPDRRAPSWALFGLLLTALSWIAPVQADDLLEQEKKRLQVAAQKAEADFREALRELQRLEGREPARAAQRYRELVTILEADTVLPEAKREGWKRVLRDRIRVIDSEATQVAQEATRSADALAKGEDRRGAGADKGRADARQQSDLDMARRLQREGNIDEAAKKAAENERRFPNSPAANAGRRIAGGAQDLKDQRALKAERDRGFELALRDVERSSRIPKGDMEFPPAEVWRELTKKRSKSNLSEVERSILKALDTAYSANLEGTKFETALDYLQTLTGVSIVVDRATLDGAGITYETPLRTRGRNITLRTLLRKMLGEFNLTYIVKDGAIQIMSPDRAREMLTTRTYYLGDLAFSQNFQFGPAFSAAQMAASVNELMQMITSTVDPDSWAVNNSGGRGTIFFQPSSMSLIIRQSAEIHAMLGGFGK